MEKKEISVLLIDDTELDNFIHSQILKELGVKDIKVFQSSMIAMSHLISTKHKYQLIFLDAVMPIMDGFEFIEKFFAFKLHQKQGQLALISASLNPTIKKTAERFDIPFIEKPLTVNKLRQANINLG